MICDPMISYNRTGARADVRDERRGAVRLSVLPRAPGPAAQGGDEPAELIIEQQIMTQLTIM